MTDSEVHEEPENNSVLGKRKRPQVKNISELGDQEIQHPHKSFFKEHPVVKTNLEPSKYGDLVIDHDVAAESAQTKSATSLVDLPPEVLQHILCFVDPFSLAQVMCTNRKFRALLDPRQSLPPVNLAGVLPLLLQDHVWSLSRSIFLPDLQKPLATTSELEALRLIYGRTCDYCGRVSSSSVAGAPVTPWNSGPGIHGVRTIWPFKVRSCTKCLRPLLLEEADVPLPLMQLGLPYVHFSPSFNYVTSFSLNRRTKPRNLKLTKYYFRPQIELFEKSAHEASLERPAAYNDWFRSLQATLTEFISECGRLEYWEELSQPTRIISIVPSDSASVSSVSVPSGIQSATQSQLTSTSHTAWQYTKSSSNQPPNARQPLQSLSLPATSYKPWNIPPGQSNAYLNPDTWANAPRSSISSVNAQNLERMRADKRAEIEKRCLQLPYPIRPDELERLKAFQAAIHILVPLDDHSWSLLRDQLLLERQEIAPSEPTLSYDAQSLLSRQTVIMEDSAQDLANPMYVKAQAQRPTRDKICEIAKDFIKRLWKGGTDITEATAPQFAADVLQHVRHRFYEIQQREDAILAINGEPHIEESQSGVRVRTLNLDHMKHVFSECIKPYTDYVRKEPFRCSACDSSDKHFAFDAVLQHYAAKHTKDFSRGNSTISWRAEWPLNPPFHPRPNEALISQAQVARSQTPTLPAESMRPRAREVMALNTLERQTAQPIYPMQVHPVSSHFANIHHPQVQHGSVEQMSNQYRMPSLPSRDAGIVYVAKPTIDSQPYHYDPRRLRDIPPHGHPPLTEYHVRYEPIDWRPPSRSQDWDNQRPPPISSDEYYVHGSDDRPPLWEPRNHDQERYVDAYSRYPAHLEVSHSPPRNDHGYSIPNGSAWPKNEASYSYDTTEHFLASLNSNDTSINTNRMPIPTTAVNHSRPESGNYRAPMTANMDRVSNSSQIRKQSRDSSLDRFWRDQRAVNVEPVNNVRKRSPIIEHHPDPVTDHRVDGRDSWPGGSSTRGAESLQRQPQYRPEHAERSYYYHGPAQPFHVSYSESRPYPPHPIEHVEQYERQVHPQPAQIRYRSPLDSRPIGDNIAENSMPSNTTHHRGTDIIFDPVYGPGVPRERLPQGWPRVIEHPMTGYTSHSDRLHPRDMSREHFDDRVDEHGRSLHDATFPQSYSPGDHYGKH